MGSAPQEAMEAETEEVAATAMAAVPTGVGSDRTQHTAHRSSARWRTRRRAGSNSTRRKCKWWCTRLACRRMAPVVAMGLAALAKEWAVAARAKTVAARARVAVATGAVAAIAGMVVNAAAEEMVHGLREGAMVAATALVSL